jgi:DNA modification methylase
MREKPGAIVPGIRTEMVPVEKLVPYAKNARTHSPEQVQKLCASLREFGFVGALLIDEAYRVLAGHGRLMAAKAEGMEAVPCIFAAGLSDAQKRAYILADNKLALDAGWDKDLLAAELSELRALGFDTELTGFAADELSALLSGNAVVREDEEFDLDAALESEVFVRLGDLWTLGRHRLLCGDATKPEDLARLMGGEKAALCVTDPPYNCDYKGKAGKIRNDKMGAKEFYSFLRAAFDNVFAHLCGGAALYVFHSDTEKVNFYKAVVDAGFHYSTTCIWVKNSMVLSRMDYQPRHEPVAVAYKPWRGTLRARPRYENTHEPVIYAFKKGHKWHGDRTQTSVWAFDRPTRSKLHPTMKPLDLMAYPVRNSSLVGELVLDPFGGSGSTMLACEQIERRCYTMELDPKYASAIVRRYAEFAGDSAQIFVERDGVRTLWKGES